MPNLPRARSRSVGTHMFLEGRFVNAADTYLDQCGDVVWHVAGAVLMRDYKTAQTEVFKTLGRAGGGG